ncbi:hypothetical protein PFISCL1PPCAC_12985, partial [Pristionchus fissidentatus]
IGDIAAFSAAAFGIYLFLKVKYLHFNLTLLFLHVYIVGPIFIISRWILIPFEMGYFALRFASSYETNQRRHIPILILSINFCISVMFGYLVVHSSSQAPNYFFEVTILKKKMLQLFVFINGANRRRQTELLDQYKGYSVSFRWQLMQNITAAKELSIMMTIANGALTVILPSLFIPAYILENDRSHQETYEMAKLLTTIFVIVMA